MFEWFRARGLSVLVGIVVLVGAACGPLALYLAVNRTNPPPGPRLELPDSRAGVVGDFASMFVAGWLRGDDLRFFHPTLTAEDSGLLVERVGAVRTVERARGLFEVVVAADLVEYLAGSEEQFRPIGLRFYAVGVSAEPSGDLAVLGLPAVVSAPLSAAAMPVAVADLNRPTAPDLGGLADTLGGFFDAYLTGQGDVRLFASPGSTVVAVAPAPFGRVAIVELGWTSVPGIDDPSLRLARVGVDAETASGRQRLEYSIVMAERDGRWEVSQLLHAPVVLTQGTAG